MEIIIGLIIIIVICKILGVSNFFIILGGLGLIELVIIAMMFFFIFAFFILYLRKNVRHSLHASAHSKKESSRLLIT